MPWFVGKDVAQALGYAKPENALAAHVDDEDKTTTLIQGTGSNYKSKAIIINESGLYSLVMSSKLPSAKKVKRWVTSEVLPSIRKYGAYMTTETLEKALLSPDFLIQLANELKREKERNEELTNALHEAQETADNLVTTNKMLTDDINHWENRSVLNALMRSYATNCMGGKFQFAYAELYKQLRYKYHIDVNQRKAHSKSDKPGIDFVKDNVRRSWN